MPRRFARTGTDFAAGESVRVMRDIDGNNILSSRNLFPNPDFRDEDQLGRIDGMDLVEREQADGWYYYLADAPGKPHERQGTTPNRMNVAAVALDHGVVRGPQPPAATKQADIVKPQPGIIDLVPLGKLGFKAASYWVGVALVVNQMRDKKSYRLITGSCSPVRVTLAQGQGFRLPLPQDDTQEGTVAYVIGMSKAGGSRNELYAQLVVGVKNGVPDTVPIRGPWSRGFLLGSNSTFVGSINSLVPSAASVSSDTEPVIADASLTLDAVTGANDVTADDDTEAFVPKEIVPEPVPGLIVKMNSGTYTLERGAYRGRCVIRRKYGWTEDEGEATETIRIYSDMPNTSLDFVPKTLPLDTEEWAVSLDFDPDPDADLDEVEIDPPLATDDLLGESVVIASDGAPVTATAMSEMSADALVEAAVAAGSGRSPRRNSRVGNSTAGGAEKPDGVSVHTGDPKKNQAQGTNYKKPKDERTQPVGVPDPTFDLEDITDDMKFGGAPITPGKKSVVWTWAQDDDESAPSTPVIVNIPQSNGVATHTIRIRRPPSVNEIDNPRFVELEQDDLESRWERKPNTGVDHIPGDGNVVQVDRSNRTTDEDVRTDSAVNVSNGVSRAFKFEMEFLDYTGGALECRFEYLNSTGVLIGQQVVGIIHKRNRSRQLNSTVGGSGSGAKYIWPTGTFFIRRVFTHIGSDPDDGARNFRAIIRGIGQVEGFQHGFKRFPLREKKREQYRPVVKTVEEDEMDYPGFGYCAVLDDWEDSPQPVVSTALFDMDFEKSGVPLPFTVSKTAGTVIGVTASEPISGKRSLRVADTGSTLGRATVSGNVQSGNVTELGNLFLFELKKAPTVGDVSFYEVRDLDGSEIARLFVRGLSGRRNKYAQIYLTVLSAGNVRTTVMLEDKAFDGEEFIFEVNVTGGGTASGGRVQVMMGKDNRKRSQAGLVASVDFTNRRPRRVVIGGDMTTNNPNATWDFRFDDILIHSKGADGYENLDGRIIEIWSPYRSPVAEIGPQGIEIPVSPLTDYVFSYYVWYRGCTVPSQPMTVTQMNGETEVRKHASALQNLTGRSGWRRVWQRIRTDRDTSHIVIGGQYGDGLIRITAPQFEQGTSPTAYTNRNAATGYTITTFDMRVPGMPTYWPANHHNEVAAFKRAGYHGTFEAGVTAITLSYSSCQDITLPVWSAWTTDLSNVPPITTPCGGFRIKAELSSTDTTKSPELREVFLDFKRRHPVLCRGDGQEYFGGMVPVDFQPVEPRKVITERLSADNTESFSKRGKRRRRAEGWWIEGYFDRGIEALMEDQGEPIPGMLASDAGTFIVEDPDIKGGRRYVVRFFNAKFTTESRDVAVDIAGVGEPLFFFKADGIEATVLSESVL